jgi:FKBP-type peptidyl-prolyl cis-trans isomerase 2
MPKEDLMDYKFARTHLYILIAVAAIVVLSAVVYLSAASSPVVSAGDTISVYYTGTLTNGTVFDSNVGKTPLVFTVGSGQLIKGFDQGVVGMKLNQSKTITIPANEAYGEVNPNLIIHAPLTQFANQTPQVGTSVSTVLNGQQLNGVVTAVNSTTATVDFNPPLAGQTLIFNITVVKIEKGQ